MEENLGNNYQTHRHTQIYRSETLTNSTAWYCKSRLRSLQRQEIDNFLDIITSDQEPLFDV